MKLSEAESAKKHAIAKIIDPGAHYTVFHASAPTPKEVMAAVDRLRVAQDKALEIMNLMQSQASKP